MRLKLTLLPLNPNTAVPLNYNYPLSSAIYHLLAAASPEYAAWLHDHGYRSPQDRLLKLFTFSRLQIPNAHRRENALTAGDDRPWLLQVASPAEDDFVQNFVLGVFENQRLEIGGPGATGRFLIESVEAIAEPEFCSTMRGKALSPILVSTQREHRGKLRPYYYLPTDPEIGEAIRRNLITKYETLRGASCSQTEFAIRFDMNYHERRQGKVTQLLTIKEGTPQETKIRGFMMPFIVQGSPELLRVAWECGLGDKNSLGMGMVELW